MKEWEIYSKTVCIVYNNAQRLDKLNKYLLITEFLIVSNLKHSTAAIKALQVTQKKLKMPKKKLIQSVQTRWNSVCTMVERLIESRKFISIVLNYRNTTTETRRK